MKKPEEKKSIYFEVDKKTLRDWHEGGRWGSWETDYSCSVLSFCKEIPEDRRRFYPYYESFELSDREYDKISDSLWAVVVTYSSGDTFGRSSGNLAIAFVSADCKLALKAAESIRNGQDWGKIVKTYPGNAVGYEQWSGYFESVEGISVENIQSKSTPNKIKIL
jgi:hypothetical protein